MVGDSYVSDTRSSSTKLSLKIQELKGGIQVPMSINKLCDA